jgi:deoxyribonuclease-4
VRIGAHVRTPGGILSVAQSARLIGAEAVQLFASNPRAWAPPRIPSERSEEFRDLVAEAGITPVYIHAPYLVNIASPNREFHRKSIDLSRESMAACRELGAAGLVVHAGSGGPGEREHGRSRAAAALGEVLAEAEGATLVVELMAGGTGAVASTFEEAVLLFDETDGGDRLRLCIDTCHLFAAGYALDTPDGVGKCLSELQRTGLSERLVLVHANDAAFPRGSRRDRHANIGNGQIGLDGFAAILADPAVRRGAVLCETPGEPEVRRRDLDTLRSLAARAA